MNFSKLGDPSLNSTELSTLGAKALRLHELKGQGFQVPAGLILTEEAELTLEMIQTVGGFPLAVRSSGALEDLDNASFAGLYETFLFVNSLEELHEAVKKCFDSRHSSRVVDYLKTKNITWTQESLKMSVLVQKMVDAKVAGVLFSLNPFNGKEEEMYLEYCEGVGERLVSGHVTPTRVRYDWINETLISEEINTEGTRLELELVQQLVQEALKIQAFYGRPQDIEWAVDKSGQLYILQSRAITSYLPREDRPELTNADFKDGGVSSRVCTPCMFSAYRNALQLSMGDYFKAIKLIPNDEDFSWIYSAYGRVYWNAQAVKSGLRKIPGYREDDFDRGLGIQKDYGEKGPEFTPVSVSSVVSAVPVLLALHKEFRDCLIMISQFRVRFELQDQLLKTGLNELQKISLTEFGQWLLEVIRFQCETEKNYFRTIYNNSNYQSELRSFLVKLPTYQAGDEIDLMGELHGVSHLDVQAGLGKLRKLADFYGFDSQSYYKGREEFLAIHYHHGPAELDITVPRWGERKEWVDELVKNYVPTSSKSGSKYHETLTRLIQGLGWWQRRKLKTMLERSRDFLRVREEMRSYSTRAYYLLRQGLCEFARRFELTEEKVFMLDLEEVKHKILLPDSSLPDTHKRELLYHGYRYFTAPNEFGGAIQSQKALDSAHGLKGLGCSPGEFTGRARVIRDIHLTAELTKEDILVTPFTDPGWTPVLARVGGVVTEVGGLLSHAAVIGREYGIPAILNLIDATKLIPDGALIKMNGKTGEVVILEEGPQGKT